jgi:hypothetical protein
MPRRKQQSRKNAGPKPVKPVVLANNQSPRPLPAPKRAPMPKGTAKPHHTRGVCSVTDPFCPASKNSKWPDGTSGNTLTEQFRGSVTLTTNATGEALSAFVPTAPFGYNNATVTAGVATLGNLTTYRANSMLATYGSSYRIVSFGCIVRCVASATNASGILTLGTGTVFANTNTITLGQELYDEVVVKAIQPGLEVSWISQPRGTGSRDFVNQSTTGSFGSDWTTLYVEITGAGVSQNVVMVEWFMNVEFMVAATTRALSAIAKPNPPKSNVAEQAVSHVHSSLGSFIEGGISVVEDRVMKAATTALSSFVSDPLASLTGLLGF